MQIFSKIFLVDKAGTEWTQAARIPNLENYEWRGVAYSGSVFIAISYEGYISKSNDGVSWSNPIRLTASGNPFEFVGITYGNGIFLAITIDAITVTSADSGETWTRGGHVGGGSVTGTNWLSVAYGENKFIAVANASYYSITTDNGTSWTPQTLRTGDYSHNKTITYANNNFVILEHYTTSEAQNAITYSSNGGETWTTLGNPYLGTKTYISLLWDGLKFIALTADGYVSYGNDINYNSWTQTAQDPNLNDNNWSCMAQKNNKIIALSKTGYISTKRI